MPLLILTAPYVCSCAGSVVTATGQPESVAPVERSRAYMLPSPTTTNIRLLVRSRNGEPLTPNTPSGISWQLVCCDPKFRCHTIVPDATSIAYRSPCSAPIYTRSFGDPLTITPVASTGCMIVTEPRSKLHNSCRPATVEGVRIDSKGFSPVRYRLKPYINQSVAVTRRAPTVSHRAARTTKMN